ncbi:MAG: dihydrofolate reductase family protein [Spirochaetota bacterium]
MEARRPYITLSYAQSADGRIATLDGHAERISGEESSEFTHTLRRDNQAIMVGIGTVLADDPLLTCRLPGGCPSPVRIILDSDLRMPTDSRIARSAETYQTIIFCSQTSAESNSGRRQALETQQIEVVPVSAEGGSAGNAKGAAGEAYLSLPAVLEILSGLGFSSLFVEGGADLITSFFEAHLVDRLCIVAAPVIIGRGKQAVKDLRVRKMEDARRGHTTSVRQVGDDIVWDISFAAASAPAITANALYFTRPQSVELRTELLQQGIGTQLITSKVIGISHGSESHLYRNSFPKGSTKDKVPGIDESMAYPIKYGYMNAGLTPGGDKVFAFFPHQDRFYYPQDQLIYFPDSYAFEDIALYPSVETAYTIVLDTAPLPGERILIIGQGMIGLLIAEILSEETGLHVGALEPDDYRRHLSTRLGLPTADPSQFDPPELAHTVRRLFHNELPDKIIHVSGSEQGLQQAIDCADFESLIIEASWHGDRRVQLNLGENFHRKRLTIRSSQVSTLGAHLGRRWNRQRRTAEVRDWVQRISPSKYVTHRFPLSEAQSAYRLLFDRKEPVLQALLIPDSEE